MTNSIVNNLTQQLCELELLKSMYPNQNEIILSDEKVLQDIKDFVENKSEYTPNHLDFVLNILIMEMKVEICVNLPSLYPDEEPDIYLRCNQLNRQEETSFNSELSNYIKSNHQGEVCLYTAILWIQENINNFKTDHTRISIKSLQEQNLSKPKKEIKLFRLWIFSHHIYNKKKREIIIDRAKDLNLSGFCLPGKPGIICIEGNDEDCMEWWKDIKSMNWKKIVIRKTETFNINERNKEQRFTNFKEIHFQNASSRHSKHADMSAFFKYIEEHNLTQSFNDFFGLCNNMNKT